MPAKPTKTLIQNLNLQTEKHQGELDRIRTAIDNHVNWNISKFQTEQLIATAHHLEKLIAINKNRITNLKAHPVNQNQITVNCGIESPDPSCKTATNTIHTQLLSLKSLKKIINQSIFHLIDQLDNNGIRSYLCDNYDISQSTTLISDDHLNKLFTNMNNQQQANIVYLPMYVAKLATNSNQYIPTDAQVKVIVTNN